MEIGKVTGQISPERCSFVKDSTSDLSIIPGDYVEIVSGTGTAFPAIVEKSSGEVIDTGVSQLIRYEYSCKVFIGDKYFDLVGFPVRLPTNDSLQSFLNPDFPEKISIGELSRYSEHIPVSLDGRRLLGTHSCFFGTSGSGKTTLLGLLLEEILLKIDDVQIVTLDLNSDFSSFDQAKTEAEVNINWSVCAPIDSVMLRSSSEQLLAASKALISSPTIRMSRFTPYSFLEALGVPFNPANDILLRVVYAHLRQQGIPITVSACLERLSQLISNPMSGASRPPEPGWLALSDDERRRATFILQSVLNRTVDAPIWSATADDSLDILTSDHSPQFVQFNLGSMSFSNRALFTECALRSLWERNESRKKRTFVVIDEAHNVAPANVEHEWQRATLEWVNRISGEGRKYGLFLVVVSQRPAKIHANTLDNCKNYFLLRLQNQGDLNYLSQSTVEVSPSLLSRVAALRTHEALVFGDVSTPVIIRSGRRRMR